MGQWRQISREKANALVVYLADGTNRIYAWRPHTTASHPTVPKWMQLSLTPKRLKPLGRSLLSLASSVASVVRGRRM
jgi:hypothetical protein